MIESKKRDISSIEIENVLICRYKMRDNMIGSISDGRH